MAESKNTTGKVTKRIMNYIKKNIREGVWQVGDKITSENELCEQLGVSRVSARNAIKQFVSLGILEVKHGKGTYLVSSDLSVFAPSIETAAISVDSLEDMKQLLQFRTMIEPSICAQVAENASPELIQRLSDSLQTMRSNIGNTRVFVEADASFHLELCYATNNQIIINIMSDIFRKKYENANMLNLANGYYGGIYYHSLLIDVIKKHDSKRAFSIMQEHLIHGIEDLSLPVEDEYS